MQNRKLLFLIILVSLFSIASLVWYFFFTTPTQAPSLAQATGNFIREILPQGNFIFGSQQKDPDQTSITEITLPQDEVLLEVWDKPTTGNSFFSKQILIEQEVPQTVQGTTTLIKKTMRATTTVLMFVDRTTGNVYGHTMDKGETYQISNTTIPGIQDAYIFDNGNRIILRYLDKNNTITSVIARIPQIQVNYDAQPLEEIAYLPNGVSSVAVSTDTKKVSYVVPNTSGSSLYTITVGNTSLTTALITTSPFSEWTISYGGSQLYATTKASAYVEGVTVSLPSFSRITGGLTGLTSIPSSNGSFIHSMWSNSGLQTFITTSAGATLQNGNLKTLPSKCTSRTASVFYCALPQSLPRATEGLPDDWYQGRVFFNDALFIVSTDNAQMYSLYSFEEEVGEMDVVTLSLSSDSLFLSFVQKQTGSLWLLRTTLISG